MLGPTEVSGEAIGRLQNATRSSVIEKHRCEVQNI